MLTMIQRIENYAAQEYLRIGFDKVSARSGFCQNYNLTPRQHRRAIKKAMTKLLPDSGKCIRRRRNSNRV